MGASWRRSTRQAIGAQTSAIGTLMKKISGQAKLSNSQPPRIGPRTGATRVVMAHSAMAAFALALGKMRSSRVWESGISSPPENPCITRPSTRTPRLWAKPQLSENPPNSAMATANTRTAPNRPAIQPVSGTTMASATE